MQSKILNLPSSDYIKQKSFSAQKQNDHSRSPVWPDQMDHKWATLESGMSKDVALHQSLIY